MVLDKTKLFGLKLSHAQKIDLSSLGNLPGYHCFLNSHMLYEYHATSKLQKVLDNHQVNIYPDGVPVLRALKSLKGAFSERIAGNDVMFSLIEMAATKNLRIFLLGGTQELLGSISDKLKDQHIIHQIYSPPYSPIDQFDFDGQAQLIDTFKPDIILVGLGCPKQELWMYHMKHLVKAPMFGLGGAFALYAGLDTRAPLWMRNLSMEWLYRLALEPGRLWKRYLVTNSYFIFLFLREFWRLRVRGKK